MIRRYRRERSVALAYALLLGLLVVAAPSFFQPDHLRALMVSSAPALVAAVGMTLVILARHIDISIGSQFSVCSVVAGLLLQAGLPLPLVAGCTLLAGALMGALNGALVAGLNLPSIVVTLGTMVLFRESLRWGREGEPVRDIPPDAQWFGAGQGRGEWLIVGIALAVFFAFAWGLRNLAVGRAVYATGSDPEAARLAGIRPRRVVFGAFVVLGALAGLAALLNLARLAHVYPNTGEGMELLVIAAVVVGGVAVSGGRGTLVGCLLGVALLGTIGPALVFLKVEPKWEKAIQGAIILAAVASEALERNRR